MNMAVSLCNEFVNERRNYCRNGGVVGSGAEISHKCTTVCVWVGGWVGMGVCECVCVLVDMRVVMCTGISK